MRTWPPRTNAGNAEISQVGAGIGAGAGAGVGVGGDTGAGAGLGEGVGAGAGVGVVVGVTGTGPATGGGAAGTTPGKPAADELAPPPATSFTGLFAQAATSVAAAAKPLLSKSLRERALTRFMVILGTRHSCALACAAWLAALDCVIERNLRPGGRSSAMSPAGDRPRIATECAF